MKERDYARNVADEREVKVKALIAERDTARGMVSERDEKIRAHADAIEDLKRRANAKMGEFDANLQVAVKGARRGAVDRRRAR